MVTRFGGEGPEFRLERLCGQPCAEGGLPATQGLALVRLDGRRYEGAALRLEAAEREGTGARCRWCVGETGVRLEAAWTVDAATGVVSRRDRLANNGDRPVTVTGCVTRVVLPRGAYECYTQASRWCRENQGAWHPLHTGLRLSHVSGRTTEGSTPYLAIRRAGLREGLVFHILPRGNWGLRVTPVPESGDLPYGVVELGLSDENLSYSLPPGGRLDLPEILCHALTGGESHLAAPALHGYLLRHHFAKAKPEAPVVYNTWFDQFEVLDVPRLRTQLAAAKEVGCEVFVIDAGWYGAGDGDWYAQTGDWRERPEAAFRGRMREFADEVRAAGLGFGVWMEPERFGQSVPVRLEHPEWFVQVGGFARMDLTQAPARAWLRAEIGRLVEDYGLAWMKVDFNFSLGPDAGGGELTGYTAAWFGLMDEVRAAYPGTFFEGCSSGALRGDMEALRHFDGHFLSDTVNPVDMLRVSQGAWLRLPPGRITRWPVLRGAGRVVPQYGKALSESAPAILVPCGALWVPAVTADLDAALLAGMPGLFGLSGDLASLPPEIRGRVAAAVTFFKQWRRHITRSIAHQLTTPESIDCREGWIGVQLQDSRSDTSLVFVFALAAAGSPPPLRLCGLAPGVKYALAAGFQGDAKGECDGLELMREGLPASVLPAGHGAGVVLVVRRIV